jgi:hypothetical protein
MLSSFSRVRCQEEMMKGGSTGHSAPHSLCRGAFTGQITLISGDNLLREGGIEKEKARM